MQLKPFLLDQWLDAHEHAIDFNLASSTGPVWTVDQLLELATAAERQQFLHLDLVYGRTAGSDGLRTSIAEMHGVTPECVQIVTGASEALLILMWLAAEPGGNVILPRPGFGTFSALPESLGLATRFYSMRREDSFCIDLGEIERLADDRTKLILVNSPHNPTGGTVSDAEMEHLHDFASKRGIQLISDEVYHPVYHGPETRSAARLPGSTVIHDFSKAFPFAGIRTGWIIERDARRRARYWNARAYFTISNNAIGEVLAGVAMRNRATILARTQEVAGSNLRRLDRFMATHSDVLGWVRPRGGMTAFPWLINEESARPFCQAAAAEGVLLGPGDCFDAPSHFRLGFGVVPDRFERALDRFDRFVTRWSSGNR